MKSYELVKVEKFTFVTDSLDGCPIKSLNYCLLSVSIVTCYTRNTRGVP